MIKSLLTNWKTSSAGILMVGGSLIHLGYQIYQKTANENTWQGCLVGLVSGLGLIFAGDAGAKPPTGSYTDKTFAKKTPHPTQPSI